METAMPSWWRRSRDNTPSPSTTYVDPRLSTPAENRQRLAIAPAVQSNASGGSGRRADIAHEIQGAAMRQRALRIRKDIDASVQDAGIREQLQRGASRTALLIEKFDLSTHMAMCAFLNDFSGSTKEFYRRFGRAPSVMQRTLAVAQPASLFFDDNGALDTFYFADEAAYCGELSLETLETFLEDYVFEYGEYYVLRVPDTGVRMNMGQTNYAAGLRAVLNLYRERLAKGPDNDGCDQSMAMHVTMVSDGGPNVDVEGIIPVLEDMAPYPIYVHQFAYGSDQPILKVMAEPRKSTGLANFSYTVIRNPNHLDPEMIAEQQISGYSKWVPAAKHAGILLKTA
jgi:hypothetical protein